MKKKSMYFIFFAIFILIILVWALVFYQNSSIVKVLNNHNQGTIKILVKEESQSGTFVIYDTGDYIRGEILKKGILGWKVTVESEPIIKGLNHKDSSAIKVDYIGFVSTDDVGYYFGYVNPNKVERVKFKNDDFTIIYNIKSHYWYLPILSKEKSQGFKAEQFSVILKDGKEVYYPFEELQ